MTNTLTPGNENGRLGFIDSATGAFDFLRRWGFEVVLLQPTRLVFESTEVYVNVYHGHSSYQVGLEVGRLDEPGQKFSLHEVLSAFAPAEVANAHCQTSNPQVLKRCLSSIAECLSRTCAPLLEGDDEAFEILRTASARGRSEATLKGRFGAILDRADQAWEAKDFLQAKELYQKAEIALEGVRRRRLDYLITRRETRPPKT